MRKRLCIILAAILCAPSFAQEDSFEETVIESPILVEHVRGFLISGTSELPTDQQKQEGIQFLNIDIPGGTPGLKKILEPYLGFALTAQDLINIKHQIIVYYRSVNHPLVSVSIPEQKVTDGVIWFVVQESVLDQVKVYGAKYFSKKIYLDAIELDSGDPIDDYILLNNLNFLNRNPFHRTDLIYAPGQKEMTTDIELIVKERFPLMVYTGVDNTGIDHTGRLRWFMGFTWANAFNRDQIFTFQYTSAADPNQFNAITVDYAIPLPIQHTLSFYGGYSQVHAHLPDQNSEGKKKEGRTHGESIQASVRYDIPISPSPWLLHEILLGFDFKRSNNTVEFVEQNPVIGQNVNLTQFLCGYNLGYERDHGSWMHKLGFDAQLFFSPFSFLPDQSNQDFRTLNPFAEHVYVYGRSSFNYKIRLPKGFQWIALVALQASNQSLLPSEQMGLGGYNTVRGYEERELNADDGLLLSTEIRFPQITMFKRCSTCKVRDALEFLLFLDYGLSHDNHKMEKIKQTDYLLGIGPGIRYDIETYLSCRFDWGIKLHRENFSGGATMVHFSVTGSF